MAEKETGHKRITEIQTRVRKKSGGDGDTLPGEDEQFLVWLEGVGHFFFVPLKTATDLTLELELIALLRDAFFNGKRVNLGYRKKGSRHYISAAWVKA